MKMKHINKVLPLGIASLGFLAATVSSQGATLSFSGTAPTVSGADISNFTATTSDANNVGNGDLADGFANDQQTYIASNTGAQGQTFTTGSNAAGYTLSSVSLQHVTYSTYYRLAETGDFVVRIGSVVGTSFTSLASENAAGGGTGNPGTAFPETGSGSYLTFTLATVVTLLPNTVYGFDVSSSNNDTVGFFETNGTNTNPYTAGTAYTSGGTGGVTGVGNATVADYAAGDRVFHVGLATIPEPSTGILGMLGGLALLRRRR